MKQFSFTNLLYLRDLFLDDNRLELKIEQNTTVNVTTIQNIYVSRSILMDANNRNYFIDLFKFKNRYPKKRFNRSFFYSLFLISDYDQYDCDLALFFIMHNIHFNFKTETDIFNYFSDCSQKRLKTDLNTIHAMEKWNFIFSDILFYFFMLTLTGIVCLTFASNFIQENNRSFLYIVN